MKRFILLIALLLATTANSAILVFSPNGTYTTKTTLSEAATAADVVGKTVVVTSALSAVQSNISSASLHFWPTDRVLKVEKGGTIGNTTKFKIDGPFSAGMYQVFAGSGALVFNSDVVNPHSWFAAGQVVTFNAGLIAEPRLISTGMVLGASSSVRDVYAEWWGAVGDGSADDIIPIQAALYARIYGTLQLLSARTYRITGQATTGPTDSGRRSINSNGATIYLDGDTAAVNVRNSKTSITGIQFTQNPANAYNNQYVAIDILNVNNVSVSGCTFYNLKKSAVKVRVEGSGSVTNVVINNNHFLNNGVGDITVAGYDATHKVSGVTINGNTFVSATSPMGAGTSDIQLRAVHVHPYSQHITISGNVMSGTAGFSGGLYTAGWRDAIMVGLSTNTGAPEYVSITGNVITGMADDGVGISGAYHVTVSGNTIYDSVVTSGVYMPSDGSFYNDDITVANNTISGMPLAGIYIKDALHATVTGNTINDCQNGIVSVKQGSNPTNVSITGNTIADVVASGIYLDGVDSGSISNNIIENFGNSGSGTEADKAAIMIATGNVGVTSNTFANGIHGVLINGAGQHFNVANNAGYNLSGYGLYFLGFTGDNFIVAYNSIGGASGVKVGDPAASASKIIEKNI